MRMLHKDEPDFSSIYGSTFHMNLDCKSLGKSISKESIYNFFSQRPRTSGSSSSFQVRFDIHSQGNTGELPLPLLKAGFAWTVSKTSAIGLKLFMTTQYSGSDLHLVLCLCVPANEPALDLKYAWSFWKTK